MEAFVAAYIAEFTYFGLFAFLMLTVFGFPFPEDAVLLVAGALVSKAVIGIAPTLVIAYIGVLVGDMLLYIIGRRYGSSIVHHRVFGGVLTPDRLKRAGRWFDRWGNPLIFFGRHMVGLRAQIFLGSGVFGIPVSRVLFYDALSAAISVPLMVWLGYCFGHNFAAIKDKVSRVHWGLTAALLVMLAAWLGWRMYKKKASGDRGKA